MQNRSPRSGSGSLPRAAVLAAVAGVLLGGCSDSLTRTFGLTRDPPDEFQVTTRAPLSMPPDYSLRPPRPGAARPQEQSQKSQAEQVLTPDVSLGIGQPATLSPGQDALVAAAGAPAPGDIRRKIEDEAQLDTPDRSFTDKLMFWKPPPKPGTVVDPAKEAQRLRENAALGQSDDAGDTPIIQPKRSGGILNSLF